MLPRSRYILPACADSAIFSKRLTLTKVNNEVVVHQQDQPADAGYEQWHFYLTETPEVDRLPGSGNCGPPAGAGGTLLVGRLWPAIRGAVAIASWAVAERRL